MKGRHRGSKRQWRTSIVVCGRLWDIADEGGRSGGVAPTDKGRRSPGGAKLGEGIIPVYVCLSGCLYDRNDNDIIDGTETLNMKC